MQIEPPVIQLAIDLPSIDEALRLAEIGVKAGVDWLEAGTPLIVRRGADAIGAIARAFPEYPVLADYKTMDSGGRNVALTAEQGGHVMTVCAGLRREHRRRGRGIGNGPACWSSLTRSACATRSAGREVEHLGADSVYLHYGPTSAAHDATRDSTQWVKGVGAVVRVPLGTGTFGIEDAVRARPAAPTSWSSATPHFRARSFVRPAREYCERVREAYHPRAPSPS